MLSPIVITCPAHENPSELAEAVEAEIAAFDAWFTAPLASGGGGNSPLIGAEKALLRTYLLARLAPPSSLRGRS